MTTPVALTIAGSDSSGGAGIQADLKTFAALGVYGASAITALTAQNTRGVTGIHAVPADFVTAQIDAVFSDLDVGAVKIGMVAQAASIDAIAAALARWKPRHVVLDPVMVATSGDRLLASEAVEALRTRLMPLASSQMIVMFGSWKPWAFSSLFAVTVLTPQSGLPAIVILVCVTSTSRWITPSALGMRRRASASHTSRHCRIVGAVRMVMAPTACRHRQMAMITVTVVLPTPWPERTAMLRSPLCTAHSNCSWYGLGTKFISSQNLNMSFAT